MKGQSNPKFIGVMAVFFLVCGGGATYYKYNSLQEAKLKVVELKAKVPSQESLEKELSETSMKLSEYKNHLAHLESEVPDVAYIPTLMKELEEVGKSFSIEVIGVRPVPRAMKMSNLPQEGVLEEKKKDYEEIQIEIKGRGNFEDVKNFIDALQKFPKVVAVNTINLSPQRDTGDRNGTKLEASINISAYVFPFKYVPVAADGAMPIDGEPMNSIEQVPVVEPPVQTATGSQAEKAPVRGHPEQILVQANTIVGGPH